jgi:hypothetical protein
MKSILKSYRSLGIQVNPDIILVGRRDGGDISTATHVVGTSFDQVATTGDDGIDLIASGVTKDQCEVYVTFTTVPRGGGSSMQTANFCSGGHGGDGGHKGIMDYGEGIHSFTWLD